MNTTATFKDAILALAGNEEARERRTLAMLERKRRERDRRTNVQLRYASLADAVVAARGFFKDKCKQLEEAAEFSAADAARLINGGARLGEVRLELAAARALKDSLPSIEAELEKLVVGAAQAALDEFKHEHKDIVGKLAGLKPSPPAPFIAPPKQDDFASERQAPPASRELRIATGHFSEAPMHADHHYSSPSTDNDDDAIPESSPYAQGKGPMVD